MCGLSCIVYRIVRKTIDNEYKQVAIATGLLLGLFNVTYAEVNNDIILQHADDQYRRSVVDSDFYRRVTEYLNNGYPAASIMLHGVSLGIPLEDIVEVSVRHDVDNAHYYYDLASSLLPSLPGWVCRSNDRYHPLSHLSDNGSQEEKTLDQIAQGYFSGASAGLRMPPWQDGKKHLDVPVEELLDLSKDSTPWYRSSVDAPDSLSSVTERPVFVSLYREDQEIRTDADPARLRAAMDAGRKSLPVVILFNETYQESVGEYGDSVKVLDIAQQFFGEGRELTAVPHWQQGDYHFDADIEELAKIFELPSQDQITPERWQTLNHQIVQDDTIRPFKVTMLQEGERLWIDDPERLAVTMQSGQTEVPVVFYFHSMNRMACGAQSSHCQSRLCDAAIAGGADKSMCQRSAGAGSSPLPPDYTGLSPRLIDPPSSQAVTPSPTVIPPVQPLPPSTASPSR